MRHPTLALLAVAVLAVVLLFGSYMGSYYALLEGTKLQKTITPELFEHLTLRNLSSSNQNGFLCIEYAARESKPYCDQRISLTASFGVTIGANRQFGDTIQAS
jgi:hypothetical protein